MYGQIQTPRHKVFISYHHAHDEQAKSDFVRLFGDAFDDYSVRDGDIEDGLSTEYVRQLIRERHIRDATVTIVLIGRETWKRKHVDWEINSSLRHTASSPRTGLLGIVLPSYTLPGGEFDPYGGFWYPERYSTYPARSSYCPNTIPPRLWDNVIEPASFARIRPWPSSSWELRDWIHEAFERRTKTPTPDLSRDLFAENRPADQNRWR